MCYYEIFSLGLDLRSVEGLSPNFLRIFNQENAGFFFLPHCFTKLDHK